MAVDEDMAGAEDMAVAKAEVEAMAVEATETISGTIKEEEDAEEVAVATVDAATAAADAVVAAPDAAAAAAAEAAVAEAGAHLQAVALPRVDNGTTTMKVSPIQAAVLVSAATNVARPAMSDAIVPLKHQKTTRGARRGPRNRDAEKILHGLRGRAHPSVGNCTKFETRYFVSSRYVFRPI